jgi:hypothetical protein
MMKKTTIGTARGKVVDVDDGDALLTRNQCMFSLDCAIGVMMLRRCVVGRSMQCRTIF